MNAFLSFDYFMVYIPECKQQLRLSEIHAIINDLDVILHGFMLQIIYTTVFKLNG